MELNRLLLFEWHRCVIFKRKNIISYMQSRRRMRMQRREKKIIMSYLQLRTRVQPGLNKMELALQLCS